MTHVEFESTSKSERELESREILEVDPKIRLSNRVIVRCVLHPSSEVPCNHISKY